VLDQDIDLGDVPVPPELRCRCAHLAIHLCDREPRRSRAPEEGTVGRAGVRAEAEPTVGVGADVTARTTVASSVGLDAEPAEVGGQIADARTGGTRHALDVRRSRSPRERRMLNGTRHGRRRMPYRGRCPRDRPARQRFQEADGWPATKPQETTSARRARGLVERARPFGMSLQFSSSTTVPCPPSAQMLMARLPPGMAASSLTVWLRMRAPVAPNGCQSRCCRRSGSYARSEATEHYRGQSSADVAPSRAPSRGRAPAPRMP
jgi:hypothetical protein